MTFTCRGGAACMEVEGPPIRTWSKNDRAHLAGGRRKSFDINEVFSRLLSKDDQDHQPGLRKSVSEQLRKRTESGESKRDSKPNSKESRMREFGPTDVHIIEEGSDEENGFGGTRSRQVRRITECMDEDSSDSARFCAGFGEKNMSRSTDVSDDEKASGDEGADRVGDLPRSRLGSCEAPHIGHCKSSQILFADPSQTVIILDYDDTLFPTTRLREMGVPWGMSIRSLVEDHPGNPDVLEVAKMIADCERESVAFLRQCAKLSKGVHLVTLAQRGWVDATCKNFMPSLGKAFQELRIPALYAREYASEKAPSDPDGAFEYWSSLKRAAIVDGVSDFYKQYPGQTWKNIVSIGDADFEREATKSAIENYFGENADEWFRRASIGSQESEGPNWSSEGRAFTCESTAQRAETPLDPIDMMLVGSMSPKAGAGEERGEPKMVKIRCKTVTLLDGPTIEEMVAQASLLRLWLSALVQRERGIDIRLTTSDNNEEIHRLHRELLCDEPDQNISWQVLGGLQESPEMQ